MLEETCTRGMVCARKEECVMLLQSSDRIDAECDIVATGLGNAEWQEVDRRLREYARHRSALDAAEAFDLVLRRTYSFSTTRA